MIQQPLMAGYANPLRVVDAADFDGTNDYMSRGADLTGSVDSKSGILSVWVRFDGGDGAVQFILDNSAALGIYKFWLYKTAGNELRIIGRTTAGSAVLELYSASTYTSGATWRHILASWDLATSGARSFYISDVDDLGTSTTINSNPVEFTTGAFYVGDSPIGLPGSKVNGALADVYFAPGQYLDFSLVTNRRKSISASGKPVHLGTDGSLPTGTAPLLYLHLDDSEAVANFATNRGTGGDLTVTGALDTASSSPSD